DNKLTFLALTSSALDFDLFAIAFKIENERFDTFDIAFPSHVRYIVLVGNMMQSAFFSTYM
ncbi:hypothetical protein ACJX0J_030419, partial [Zea mays]